MEKKCIALKTRSFTEGQAIADIIKGNEYIIDYDNEYFVGQFGNTIYLPQAQFSIYFKQVQNENSKAYRNRYFKERVKSINLRFFPSDQDIIDHLEGLKATTKSSQKNGVCEYIRRLIREDIAKTTTQLQNLH